MPDAFAYRDKTTSFPDDLGLPSLLELYPMKDGLQRSLLDKRVHRTKTLNPHHPNMRADELKCRYIVTASTNFMGWEFPARFELVQYKQNARGEMQRYAGAAGKLLKLELAKAPTNFFAAGKFIVDYRFRDDRKVVDSLTYSSVWASLPPMDTPPLQDKFRERVRKARPDPTTHSLLP
jgi:hypothetical protein